MALETVALSTYIALCRRLHIWRAKLSELMDYSNKQSGILNQLECVMVKLEYWCQYRTGRFLKILSGPPIILHKRHHGLSDSLLMAKGDTLRLLTDVAFLVGAGTSVYYMLSILLNAQSEGGRQISQETSQRAADSLRRLQREDPDRELVLDEYENTLLASVVGPSEISVGFKDIGGLSGIIDELRECVLYPLMEPALYQSSSLLQAPKGVLLYGPPGCGKTMLAKALAAESGANFLNIKMSTIMDKWYGESNKLVAAIFSLAQKLEPCIIFIDEIDSFMRERATSDHEATAMVKAEFMTWWDGLTTAGRVIVLGATNRPSDIDKAILRRLPKRFAVPLPAATERRRILKLLLRDTKLDEKDFDLEAVVVGTQGLSGSDLKEVCRDAAMRAMREFFRTHYRNGKKLAGAPEHMEIRPLRTSDFFTHGHAAPQLPNGYVPENIPEVD